MGVRVGASDGRPLRILLIFCQEVRDLGGELGSRVIHCQQQETAWTGQRNPNRNLGDRGKCELSAGRVGNWI